MFYVNWLKNGSLLKFKMSTKSPIYSIKQTIFKHFELWGAAVFEPLDLWKCYIPQKKALKFAMKFEKS